MFLDMIGKRQLPLYVLSAYDRAVRYSLRYRYECIQKERTHNDTGFSAGDVGEDLEGA